MGLDIDYGKNFGKILAAIVKIVEMSSENTTTSTRTPTREQRIAYKRLQILAEMNESIHTLTKIEAVLDQITQCIVPAGNTSGVALHSSKRSDTNAVPNLSDKMNQLLIELQKWDDDF